MNKKGLYAAVEEALAAISPDSFFWDGLGAELANIAADIGDIPIVKSRGGMSLRVALASRDDFITYVRATAPSFILVQKDNGDAYEWFRQQAESFVVYRHRVERRRFLSCHAWDLHGYEATMVLVRDFIEANNIKAVEVLVCDAERFGVNFSFGMEPFKPVFKIFLKFMNDLAASLDETAANEEARWIDALAECDSLYEFLCQDSDLGRCRTQASRKKYFRTGSYLAHFTNIAFAMNHVPVVNTERWVTYYAPLRDKIQFEIERAWEFLSSTNNDTSAQ